MFDRKGVGMGSTDKAAITDHGGPSPRKEEGKRICSRRGPESKVRGMVVEAGSGEAVWT